jgi:ADP-ribosylglycohydrolase
MIGAIAGDIVGSRFEGLPLVPDDFELFHPQCAFTDDTICLLAVADAMLGDRDFGGNLRTLARQYPMRGYGRSFIQWFTANEAPAYGSFGNGSPMRVASVGWLAASESEVFEFADAQSVVTHNHPEAMAAARAVALSIFLARRGSSASEIKARIETDYAYDLESPRQGFDIRAGETTARALGAAFAATSWEDAVRRAMAGAGDTDTLASIAGGVAEALYSVPSPIHETAKTMLPKGLLLIFSRFEETKDLGISFKGSR